MGYTSETVSKPPINAFFYKGFCGHGVFPQQKNTDCDICQRKSLLHSIIPNIFVQFEMMLLKDNGQITSNSILMICGSISTYRFGSI